MELYYVKQKEIRQRKKTINKRLQKYDNQKSKYIKELSKYLNVKLVAVTTIYKFAFNFIEKNFGNPGNKYRQAKKIIDEFSITVTDKNDKSYRKQKEKYINELERIIKDFDDSYNKFKRKANINNICRIEQYEEYEKELRAKYYKVGLWAFNILSKIRLECNNVDYDKQLQAIQKKYKKQVGEYCEQWDKNINKGTFSVNLSLILCSLISWSLLIDANYFKVLMCLLVFMFFWGTISSDCLMSVFSFFLIIICLVLFFTNWKYLIVDRSQSFIDSRNNGLVKYYWFDNKWIKAIPWIMAISRLSKTLFDLPNRLSDILSSINGVINKIRDFL